MPDHPPSRSTVKSARSLAPLLWTLELLFLGRVIGQILVAFLQVRWLPPMKEWMSGLLPYPGLLTSQILILSFQTRVALDFTRGRGFFVARRPAAGRFLRGFSFVYAGGMAVRYVVTMAIHPERRWAGAGTIPIIFHLVLAAWLFTFARHSLRADRLPAPGPGSHP